MEFRIIPICVGLFVGYFLVGGWPTPLKNMKVSWDDDIPNWMKKSNSCSKPRTRFYGLISVDTTLLVEIQDWNRRYFLAIFIYTLMSYISLNPIKSTLLLANANTTLPVASGYLWISKFLTSHWESVLVSPRSNWCTYHAWLRASLGVKTNFDISGKSRSIYEFRVEFHIYIYNIQYNIYIYIYIYVYEKYWYSIGNK